jgi:hypothetical protein
MAGKAEKQTKRAPLKPRPRPDLAAEPLFDDISDRFSETLKYLAK